jgi:transcriptional regulator with XRE-family HTH domain
VRRNTIGFIHSCPGLATCRAARGGTIESEAAASGVTRQTWWRWERGHTKPSAVQLRAVAERWGVELERLTSDAVEPETLVRVRGLVERHGVDDVRSALAMVCGFL